MAFLGRNRSILPHLLSSLTKWGNSKKPGREPSKKWNCWQWTLGFQHSRALCVGVGGEVGILFFKLPYLRSFVMSFKQSKSPNIVIMVWFLSWHLFRCMFFFSMLSFKKVMLNMKHHSQYVAIQSHSLHISFGTPWSLNHQQIITIYKPYKNTSLYLQSKYKVAR